MRVLLLAAALLLAGCASPTDDGAPSGGTTTTTPPTQGTTTTTTTPPTAQAPTGDVVIAAFRYAPQDVAKPVGATVRWANQDDVAHTVTADDGAFDSGVIPAGGTFDLALSAAGTVPYHCKLHPSMRGNVTATAPPTTTTTPPTGDDTTTTTTTTTTPPTQASSAPMQAGVDVAGFRYQPATVTLAAGGTVTWTNRDSAPHTVTGDGFDSGTLEDEATYAHTFPTPGTYAYRCAFHGSMRGTVVVQ